MKRKENRRATIIFLISLSAATIWFGYLIARPFLQPVLSAIVLAIVCYPAHSRLNRYIPHRNFAALLSTLLVLLLIILPAVLLGIAIKRELTEIYQALNAQSGTDGGWIQHLLRLGDDAASWLGRHLDLRDLDLRSALRGKLQQASDFLLGKAANVLGDVGSFLVSSVVAFLTLFFLFRDGRTLSGRLMTLMPLKPEQRGQLLEGISQTIIATVYGGVAVAVAQGLLVSLVFWALALPSPVLWGMVTAMFSFVPFVGSSAVWLPASILLLVSGNWVKGLILLGVGAGVIGLTDNIVRPYVISERVHFHPLYVFFALLGGAQAFGLIGLFVGPVVLAVGQALFQLLREETTFAHDASERGID